MKKQLVVLGVSAALLAGLATLASAEPYGRPERPAPRAGVSIRVNLPIFGWLLRDVRPVEHDGYRHGERGEQHARYGHEQYGGQGQSDCGSRGERE